MRIDVLQAIAELQACAHQDISADRVMQLGDIIVDEIMRLRAERDELKAKVAKLQEELDIDNFLKEAIDEI